MKKKLLIILCSFIAFASGYSQKSFWTKISEEQTNALSKMDRASIPLKYSLFSLKLDDFKSALLNAPNDLTGHSNVIMSFPNADGVVMNYEIYKAPIMEESLANKYPDIKSYSGKNLEDPTSSIRFSVTNFGLHAMIFSENGTYYIDAYTTDKKNYIVYNKSDITRSKSFQCHVKDNFKLDNQPLESDKNSILRTSDGRFRTFRLAMACTIEYAAFHVNAAGLNGGTLAQKKAAVLSAMTVTMTRVNAIYERDMSMRMVLIANQDPILFIDSDNFTNNDAFALIDESQAQITAIIGNANFDIGHTVSTGGGGLAGTSPCVNGQKASGITGSGAPVGDPYDIDYVAHEMGHQFGANHTFNNSCGGNRNNSTAVEPGSGTTIMAYAGICGPNIQNNSDDHFHAISIAEMLSRINSTANCANSIVNNNTAPLVNAGIDYTIPKGTAYVLKGIATDANNDALTYCWEQTDTQISTQPPTQLATSGPSYRSRTPSSSPDRFMPVLSSVIAGNLNPTWEVTPNTARTINFALTVRDNRMPNGGQTGRDNTIITVNGVAGPFTVTSQNTTGISYTGLSNQIFTWNVAGTTANGVNTANVKITLSTNNGLTFPTVLIASTLNDGSESVQIPNGINSTNCRVKIEAVGNLFYSVNSTRFTITNSLSSNSFDFDNFNLFPNPNKGNFTLSFTSDNFSDIVIDVHDISGRKVYNNKFSNTETFNQNINLNKVQSGIYLVSITNGDKKSIKRIIVQ